MEEIVVNPHTGRWWTVGTHGAEFVDIPKNAIVFNHKQSEALLKNGNIFSRGKALAGGTALASGTKSKLTSGNNNNSSSSKSSSSSTSSADWDSMLDSYEQYVNKYIALMKKASNGDVTAITEYAGFLQKAQELSDKMENAQGDMSASQWARYMKITKKMTKAAQ